MTDLKKIAWRSTWAPAPAIMLVALISYSGRGPAVAYFHSALFFWAGVLVSVWLLAWLQRASRKERAMSMEDIHNALANYDPLSEPSQWWYNYYRCPKCEKDWDQEYDSPCKADCPWCGEPDVVPHTTEDLTDDTR